MTLKDRVYVQVLAPAQIGKMCTAAWPHLLDFPALVHVVASQLEASASDSTPLPPMPSGIPDFLHTWLDKQPKAVMTEMY